MNTTKKTTKILSTVAALMLFSAVEANAGSVIIDGYVDFITAAGATGVTENSLVSLELNWMNDSLVKATGESTIYLNPSWGNSFTFTVGNISLTSSKSHGGGTPTAHFTDGNLDGFAINWFDSSLNGVSGTGWAIFADGLASNGSNKDNIFWDIQDNGSTTGAWFEGYLTPQASPVPVPAAAWLLGSGLVGLIGIRRKMK